MKKGILAISLVGLVVAQENISPRNLFMSTAGSEVYMTQEKEQQKGNGKKSPNRENVKKTQEIKPTLGMYVEVYTIKGGKPIPVDYKNHNFRTGDRFKVKVYYNSPGIVEFINIDPKGKPSYLGRYAVEEPFSGTLLPADGSFIFTDTKGVEKLIVNFYPCRFEDKSKAKEINTVSSRSIALVKDEEYKPASFAVDLPACNMEDKRPQSVEAYVASSRGITVVEERTERRTYYFVSADNYLNQKSPQPITAVLELRHR